jgi:hypothetical protein
MIVAMSIVLQSPFRALFLVLALAAAAAAQQKSSKPKPPKSLEALGAEFKALGDWGFQSRAISASVENIWKNNGWDSEPDQFAKTVMQRVSAVPPWDVPKRIETFSNAIGERYELNPSQRLRLRARMMRETIGLFAANTDVITRQVREHLATGAARKPYTPEMVARWTKESDDLVADAIFRFDRITDATTKDFTDAQKALFARDQQSYDRRMNDFLKQRASWAKGEWKPQAWGAPADPAQPAVPVAKTPNEPSAVMPPDPDMAWANESTWERWVRQFTTKHALDPGQRTAIKSILTELEQRAARYRTQHAEAIDSGVIQAMFSELRVRSEALLTITQRPDETGP